MIKNTLTTLTAAALLGGLSLGLQAAPSVEEVKADIEAFQGYYKKRFPDVPLEAYNDGVNALPQYAHRRANWEMIMEFPPYEPEMETAQEEWAAPFKNGKTFADCFADKPSATQYPWYDEGDKTLHTIVGDINACLTGNGEEAIKNLNTGKIARLVAAYKEQFNGEPIAVDVSSEGAREWYQKGRKFYWTKRGQLNFACADCHMRSAGKSIRGDVLSAGLGHTSGFPVYRTKWALKGKPWGTIHRRYKGCNEQVRAAAFKPQSDEYKAVELYEAVMNTGIPMKVPSQRQ
ncbi:MAG: sulfur oxidation c-type cytochrome SoxA [Pseudomonadota bacterium]|nr:sulfur oxidation c-type cytochrome SoxA [Pseudomonadota bacterium]